MSPWFLLPISLIVLYVAHQMLKIVFRGIDLYHAAASSRNNGRQRVGSRGG